MQVRSSVSAISTECTASLSRPAEKSVGDLAGSGVTSAYAGGISQGFFLTVEGPCPSLASPGTPSALAPLCPLCSHARAPRCASDSDLRYQPSGRQRASERGSERPAAGQPVALRYPPKCTDLFCIPSSPLTFSRREAPACACAPPVPSQCPPQEHRRT